MKKKSETANRLLKAMRQQKERIQRADAQMRQRRVAAGDTRATGRLDKRSAR